MKRVRTDLALHRILDALEADLLAATPEEIQAAVAETGMSAKALLSDGGVMRDFFSSAVPVEEVMAYGLGAADARNKPSPQRGDGDDEVGG
jgi:hypothetical protein